MKKRLYILSLSAVLLFTFGIVSAARAESISGCVLDKKTLARIEDAQVQFMNAAMNVGRQTNANGIYTTGENFPPGKYAVVITKDGYEAFTFFDVTVAEGTDVELPAAELVLKEARQNYTLTGSVSTKDYSGLLEHDVGIPAAVVSIKIPGQEALDTKQTDAEEILALLFRLPPKEKKNLLPDAFLISKSFLFAQRFLYSREKLRSSVLPSRLMPAVSRWKRS